MPPVILLVEGPFIFHLGVDTRTEHHHADFWNNFFKKSGFGNNIPVQCKLTGDILVRLKAELEEFIPIILGEYYDVENLPTITYPIKFKEKIYKLNDSYVTEHLIIIKYVNLYDCTIEALSLNAMIELTDISIVGKEKRSVLESVLEAEKRSSPMRKSEILKSLTLPEFLDIIQRGILRINGECILSTDLTHRILFLEGRKNY